MRTPENVFQPFSSAFANPCNSGRVSHDAMADSPVYIYWAMAAPSAEAQSGLPGPPPSGRRAMGEDDCAQLFGAK
eukprot:14353772-Alexandrium_andersonii.AAC.1